MLFLAGNFAEANLTLSSLIEAESAEATLLYGLSLLHLGEVQEAIDALAPHPHWQALLQTWQGPGPRRDPPPAETQEQSSVRLLTRGLDLLHQAQPYKALRWLQEAWNPPTYLPTYNSLLLWATVTAYLRCDDPAQALKYVLFSQNSHTEHPVVYRTQDLATSMIRRDAGDLAEAQEHYNLLMHCARVGDYLNTTLFSGSHLEYLGDHGHLKQLQALHTYLPNTRITRIHYGIALSLSVLKDGADRLLRDSVPLKELDRRRTLYLAYTTDRYTELAQRLDDPELSKIDRYRLLPRCPGQEMKGIMGVHQLPPVLTVCVLGEELQIKLGDQRIDLASHREEITRLLALLVLQHRKQQPAYTSVSLGKDLLGLGSEGEDVRQAQVRISRLIFKIRGILGNEIILTKVISPKIKEYALNFQLYRVVLDTDRLEQAIQLNDIRLSIDLLRDGLLMDEPENTPLSQWREELFLQFSNMAQEYLSSSLVTEEKHQLIINIASFLNWTHNFPYMEAFVE